MIDIDYTHEHGELYYKNDMKQGEEIKAIRERHKYLEDIRNIVNIWIITILVTRMKKPAHSTVT